MAESLKGLTIQEIDTNMLFEKYTIEEIRAIEKRTGSDIEHKKEELRQMVGERYRDLIEAADTISDMKASAENVSHSLTSIQKHCERLDKTHMIKGMTGSHTRLRSQGDKKIYEVASQIKLLLDMPEKIWSAIDSCQYLVATELFLLCRHVYTSLQSGRHVTTDTLKSFPVVSWQWAAIGHFKSTILQGCHNTLKKEDIGSQVIADCLSSIMLLEESNVRQVFTEFLLARSNTIQAIFQGSHDSIKSQVCRVVDLLQTTILQIHALFHTDTHLLMDTLTRVTTSPTVSCVLLHGSSNTQHLPSTVLDYIPSLRSPASNITREKLTEACQEWVNTCQSNIKTGLSALLCYIGSVKGLASIRDALQELLQVNQNEGQDSWNTVCEQVINKRITVWEEFVQPLIFKRAEEIISTQFDATQQATRQHIDRCLGSDHVSSGDLTSFIWTESSRDVPDNAAWTVAQKKSLTEGGGLLMKAKAYTPPVQSVCFAVNSKVKCILDDACTYCDSAGGDSTSVLSYLRILSADFIKKLVQHVNEKLSECEASLQGQESVQLSVIDSILLLGRVCLGVSELCPQLVECILGKADVADAALSYRAKRTGRGTSGSSELDKCIAEWNQLKSTLVACTQQAFDLWSRFISEKLIKDFRQAVLDHGVNNKLTSATRWDDIEVEEETEKGQKVKSTIRVPCQPSWYVSAMLFDMCREVNRVGGHALSRKSLNFFIKQSSLLIVDIYTQLLENNKESSWMSTKYTLTQSRALQHVFDLKFLNSLLSRKSDTEENDVFVQKVPALIENLESCVDPFDLDVFSPHVERHLLRQSQRSLVLFGALACADKHGAYGGARASTTGQQEQHNVLPLTASCGRFSLLPVTTPQTATPAERVGLIKPQISPAASQPIISLANRTQSQHMKTSASFYDKLGSLWS